MLVTVWVGSTQMGYFDRALEEHYISGKVKSYSHTHTQSFTPILTISHPLMLSPSL